MNPVPTGKLQSFLIKIVLKGYPCIITICPCSLHILPGSDKVGVESVGRIMGKFRKVMWNSFQDSSTRRET